MLFQSESATGAKLRKVDYLLHIILNRNIASDWCASLKAVNTGGSGMGFLKTSCCQLEVICWLIFPLSELNILYTKQSGKETAVQTVWCLETANYISTGCSNLRGCYFDVLLRLSSAFQFFGCKLFDYT